MGSHTLRRRLVAVCGMTDSICHTVWYDRFNLSYHTQLRGGERQIESKGCHMRWLRFVVSLKGQVAITEHSLFYRAFLQKRPTILRSLLIVATPQIQLTMLSLLPSRRWRRQRQKGSFAKEPQLSQGSFAKEPYKAMEEVEAEFSVRHVSFLNEIFCIGLFCKRALVFIGLFCKRALQGDGGGRGRIFSQTCLLS